jgi:acetyl esterase
LNWVYKNSEELGGHPDNIHLAGSSAGGNLIISLLTKQLDEKKIKIASMSAVYPAVGHIFGSQSFQKYGKGHFLTENIIRWFNKSYLDEEHHTDILAVPLLVESLKGFPRTLIVLAEKDPLFDEGMSFHEKLKKENGDEINEIFVIEGIIHGFIELSEFFPVEFKKALNKIGNFINKKD